MAIITAWVRSETSNFVKIALIWLRTVPSERWSWAAISILFKPYASRRNTASSRIHESYHADAKMTPSLLSRFCCPKHDSVACAEILAIFRAHIQTHTECPVVDRWNRRTGMIISDLGAGRSVLAVGRLYLTRRSLITHPIHLFAQKANQPEIPQYLRNSD
jgi:hypothetical protein